MDKDRIREALDELLDYLEQVETQSTAVLWFLRDNGGATEEKLAPYFKEAENATDVKSRAIRARFDFLFSKDEAKPEAEGVPAGSASNNRVTQAAQQRPEQERANAGRSSEKEKEAA